MASFTYTAINAAGKEIRGTISADNRESAIAKLKSNGVTPTTVETANALNKDIEFGFMQKKPKPRDMAIFCRQMVSILSAGVSMSSALSMLEDQTENKVLRQAISGCRLQIESGSSMSDAMRGYKVFPDIFVTMVAAGETSGSLEVSFSRMAERFEKDSKMKGLVKKATMYPIVVGIVAVVVVIVMMTYIVPKFEDILTQLNTELPGLTKGVIAVSDFISANIIYIIIAVILLILGFRYFKKTDTGSHFIGNLMLKLPLFGKLTKLSSCSNMARTLSTLLAAGIPMIEALEITADVMTNVNFKDALLEAKSEVAVGTNLSEALERTAIFPALVYHMTKIGEETGDIVEMFDSIANYYDEEVEQTTEQVMAALEPMIIVLLAGIVGTIVISLILPMASMYGSLDNL